MENQHRSIKGYRELSEDEIALMNEVKQAGASLGAIIDTLQSLESIDKRWLAIGRTELQQGLMAVTRSIAKPDFF